MAKFRLRYKYVFPQGSECETYFEVDDIELERYQNIDLCKPDCPDCKEHDDEIIKKYAEHALAETIPYEILEIKDDNSS